MQYTLVGAHIRVRINNTVSKETQAISFDIDYGEKAIDGIDSPYPQEIAPGAVRVSGTITQVRQKNSGGIQSKTMRPLYTDIAAAPYISILVEDRQSGESLLFLPQAKVTKESHSAAAKGMYRVTIGFTAIVPLMPLDRA